VEFVLYSNLFKLSQIYKNKINYFKTLSHNYKKKITIFKKVMQIQFIKLIKMHNKLLKLINKLKYLKNKSKDLIKIFNFMINFVII
jgi:hypothetical protein